jgi:AraC family ethanolamine operon transcriptional activator
MHSKILSMDMTRIEGSDQLRECTRGSDVDIVQLKAGRQRGFVAHIAIDSLEMSVGRFALDARARGLINPNRVTLGMMLTSPGRVSYWWEDVRPGDVVITPPGAEIDAIYRSGAWYVAIGMVPSDLTSVLGGEDRLPDPRYWNMRGVRHVDSLLGEEVRRRLARLVLNLKGNIVTTSPQAVDFLRRSIIEAFVISALNALPQDRAPPPCTGARLVSEVERYVDAADGRPVHISELCSALKVPRRTLHRAFVDTLNMGPVGYLRHRRLSAVQTALKRTDRATTPIADIAFEYGFPDPGRFAAYYRSLFGESPSQTRRSVAAEYKHKRTLPPS